MTTAKTIAVGDTYWRGFGMRNGRDVDDATSEPCETQEAAIEAITDDWYGWLSPREQDQAEVYARQLRCLAVEDDGSIGAEVTIDC